MAEVQEAPSPNPAEIYEQLMVRLVFGPLMDRVLDVAAPPPGARVLDIATGTGIVLRKIAKRSQPAGSLTGLDFNPAMLEVARARSKQEGVSATWHQGNATELPFPDGSFDWVFCQHGLQFFPDQALALREMHRVLDQEGKAVIAVWRSLDDHHFVSTLDQAGYEHTGMHILEQPFSLHDGEGLMRMLAEAGFRESWIEPISMNAEYGDPEQAIRLQVASATAAIPSLQQLTPEERADLIDGVVSLSLGRIDEFISDGKLYGDWHANVAIAQK